MDTLNQRCIAIIQARMGSERFPRKVLYPLGGKPALEHLIDAARQVFTPERMVLATSLDPANDPVAELAGRGGLSVFRGDEHNVASRFKAILEERDDADYFVRLNGDSPLMDYRVIRDAARLALSGEADIVSTSSQRQFPSGLNVEVLQRGAFLSAYPRFEQPGHFEHVTQYFYEHPADFRILSLPAAVDRARDYKFSFDTDRDRIRIETFFAALTKPHYEYPLAEKCRIYEALFGGDRC